MSDSPVQPHFTRALVISRPFLAVMSPPAHDFRLMYLPDPDSKTRGEEVFLSYAAADPIHLARLISWCLALLIPVKEFGIGTALPKPTPDASLF
jgi:hypothetical protein